MIPAREITSYLNYLAKVKRVSVVLLILLDLLSTLTTQAEMVFSPFVRVKLTALQLSDNLTVGIYGNYLLDDRISFQRGSEMRVSAADGTLIVLYEGMRYKAGESIHLKRYQTSRDENENGLRLQKGLNVFPGDLKLDLDNGSLRAVISIPLEEYLLGVVPYEMSEEFPLEALKAQAVAARTYTIKNLKPGQVYDLVDNTNDQVFLGLGPMKNNAIKSVNETEGVILTYQGKPADCFYTASNGGYSESAFNAWGREEIPYLTVREDPYDLENPLSVTRSAIIPKTVMSEGKNLNSQLFTFLSDRLAQHLGLLGFDTNQEFIKINGIAAITPHTPKFGGSDGVMRALRFDLNVSARAPAQLESDPEVSLSQQDDLSKHMDASSDDNVWAPVKPLPQTVSVDCPLFPDLEKMLDLSINQNENELVRITEKEDHFVISFTRYGHGVGLSQRGAEWMAKTYDWDYGQILRFYYPGTQLEHFDTKAYLPETLQPGFLTTPGPVPTSTPRPTLMPQSSAPAVDQRVVFVTGIGLNSSLNLRAMPSLSSEVLLRLYYGQELLVLKSLPDGWLYVKTDVIQGYIRDEFVSEK